MAAFARIGFCLRMSKTFRPWTIAQPLWARCPPGAEVAAIASRCRSAVRRLTPRKVAISSSVVPSALAASSSASRIRSASFSPLVNSRQPTTQSRAGKAHWFMPSTSGPHASCIMHPYERRGSRRGSAGREGGPFAACDRCGRHVFARRSHGAHGEGGLSTTGGIMPGRDGFISARALCSPRFSVELGIRLTPPPVRRRSTPRVRRSPLRRSRRDGLPSFVDGVLIPAHLRQRLIPDHVHCCCPSYA